LRSGGKRRDGEQCGYSADHAASPFAKSLEVSAVGLRRTIRDVSPSCFLAEGFRLDDPVFFEGGRVADSDPDARDCFPELTRLILDWNVEECQTVAGTQSMLHGGVVAERYGLDSVECCEDVVS